MEFPTMPFGDLINQMIFRVTETDSSTAVLELGNVINGADDDETGGITAAKQIAKQNVK